MITKYKISRQERKILVHNKMKEGLTYKEAYEQVAQAIEQVAKIKKKEEIVKPKDFKKDFESLVKEDGHKRRS